MIVANEEDQPNRLERRQHGSVLAVSLQPLLKALTGEIDSNLARQVFVASLAQEWADLIVYSGFDIKCMRYLILNRLAIYRMNDTKAYASCVYENKPLTVDRARLERQFKFAQITMGQSVTSEAKRDKLVLREPYNVIKEDRDDEGVLFHKPIFDPTEYVTEFDAVLPLYQ
jgi:hypothetical protein